MHTQIHVFDDIARTDTAPGKRNGSDFEFINTSARPKAERARAIIEAWFEHLPDDVKPEFRARLRQKDDQHFRAAFFELYLHELLLRSGFTVEFHPPSEKGKRPDFKVYRNGVAVFYLEGRAAGDSVAKSAKQHIVDDAYDAIDRMPCPDFFLQITVEGEPKSPVPVKKGLRRELEAWIGSLDYDAVAALWRAAGPAIQLRRSDDRPMVAKDGAPALQEGSIPAHHGRCGGQQRIARPPVEMGTPATGKSDGPVAHDLSLPARDQQVEQDRASTLLSHQPQLAWTTSGEPSRHRQSDRGHSHDHGVTGSV